MSDAWSWVAHYEDGSMHPEFDDAGADVGYRSLDPAQIVALELVPQREGVQGFTLHLGVGQRPNFLRRRFLGVGVDVSDARLAIIRWQRADGTTSYLTVDEGGHLIFSEQDIC